MSNFVKPSTPTKIRSNIKSLTPTMSKSMSCINIKGDGSSTSGSNISTGQSLSEKMSEENLYLYLEAVKRNMDNEAILKQKVEEAYRAFEERRCKHANLVSKYATLVKLANTRKALQQNEISILSTTAAQDDAKSIKEKLSSGSATDNISTTELNKFKNILQQMGKYKNLSIKRSELVDLQNATDAIRYSVETIEKSLEKGTIQGLDHFTSILDAENYPGLLNENYFNE